MEKAILKTLQYADSFGYPMTLYEIHKWLIGKKTYLRTAEKTLKALMKKGKVKEKDGYFFLSKRIDLVESRISKKNKPYTYIMKLSVLVFLLKFIPWIKLVGVNSQGLLVISEGQKNLAYGKTDIYQAHEVLGMKVIWQRDNVYQKYLEENAWAMKFLPNWVSRT